MSNTKRKEQIIDTCINTHDLQNKDKWKKIDKNEYILNDLIYIKSQKMQANLQRQKIAQSLPVNTETWTKEITEGYEKVLLCSA